METYFSHVVLIKLHLLAPKFMFYSCMQLTYITVESRLGHMWVGTYVFPQRQLCTFVMSNVLCTERGRSEAGYSNGQFSITKYQLLLK